MISWLLTVMPFGATLESFVWGRGESLLHACAIGILASGPMGSFSFHPARRAG